MWDGRTRAVTIQNRTKSLMTSTETTLAAATSAIDEAIQAVSTWRGKAAIKHSRTTSFHRNRLTLRSGGASPFGQLGYRQLHGLR